MNRRLYEARQDLLDAKDAYHRAYMQYMDMLESDGIPSFRGVDGPNVDIDMVQHYREPAPPNGYVLVFLGNDGSKDLYLGIPTYNNMEGKMTDISFTGSNKGGCNFKLIYVDDERKMKEVSYMFWGKNDTSNEIFNVAMKSPRISSNDKKVLHKIYLLCYHDAQRINNAGRGRGVDISSDAYVAINKK